MTPLNKLRLDTVKSLYPKEANSIDLLSTLNATYSETELYGISGFSSIREMQKILSWLEYEGYPVCREYRVIFLDKSSVRVKSLDRLTDLDKDRVTDIGATYVFYEEV